jgi:hypothetical protein
MVSAAFAGLQLGIRLCLCARIYGMRFAAASPLRMFWGNAVNCVATAEAIGLFVGARLARHAPAWRKTEHIYPREPLLVHRRPMLGEVLVSLRCISMKELEDALVRRPPGTQLGEYLIQLEKITKGDLDRALDSQAGLPVSA